MKQSLGALFKSSLLLVPLLSSAVSGLIWFAVVHVSSVGQSDRWIIVGSLVIPVAGIYVYYLLNYLKSNGSIADQLRRESASLDRLFKAVRVGSAIPGSDLEDVRFPSVVLDKINAAQANPTKNIEERIRDLYNNDISRLTEQLDTLRNRGNLNLVIGIVTTGAAAATLLLTVTLADPDSRDLRKLSVYLTTRIATVIFIETFAFFFLRLYKSTLEEEKYYQGELSERSSRQAAIEAAYMSNTTPSMERVIELLATARTKSSATELSTTITNVKDAAPLLELLGKITEAYLKKG